MKNYTRVLLFLFVSLCIESAAAGEKPGTKPNIIFIVTDDHRWDAMGVAGNRIIQTPNLDKLANGGIMFKNAYVTTSICAVSRASMLAGQYESRHKINNFDKDFSPEALQKTYPKLLKDAGYKIGFVGKYGVGTNPPIDMFDYWSCVKKGQPPYIFTDKQGKEVHHTDSVASDIKIFLDKFADQGPFCLSVGFKAPHELDGKVPKFIPQERFNQLYKNITIPEPETAAPQYWNNFPDFFRTEQNVGRDRWKTFFSTPEKYQESVKNYYRLISGVDEVIGKMVNQLKKLGLDKNTIIIFTGDNGFYLGEHGLEGKWYGHEESIRVPLIVYDPRMPANEKGKKIDQIALNVDIAPTILSIAGSNVPGTMQGQNLYDIIRRKNPGRTEFFYEHTFSKSPRIPNVEGVVTRDFKYMKFIEHGYEELYSIKSDPKEKVNLASDPKYASKLNELRTKYSVLKKSVQ